MQDRVDKFLDGLATRSGEVNLFGDDVDGAAVAVVDGPDTNDEVAQVSEGPDYAEGPAVSLEELKIVVSIEGGRSTIGVQQPSSDPHVESFDGLDLPGLAQEIPVVIERARARARWEDEPMYPAHERPSPPPRRRTRRNQALAQAPTAEEGSDQQQPETLRLL